MYTNTHQKAYVVQQHTLPRHLPSAPFTFTRHSVPHPEHKEYNEDTVIADQRNGLAAVFDGVGGRNKTGMVASQLGARVVRKHWKRVLRQTYMGNTPSWLTIDPTFDLPAAVQQLIEEAQEQIRIEGVRRDPFYPSTTVALAVFCRKSDGSGYMMGYGHVGDSRIYLLRPQATLVRLTADDGYLALLLKDQAITEADVWRIDQATSADQLCQSELEYFHKRNGVSQVLSHPHPHIHPLDIHVGQQPITPGDRVLICCDGIHDNLTDHEIEETLRRGPRTTTARLLVAQATQRSQQECLRAKRDDMSAVVISCHF